MKKAKLSSEEVESEIKRLQASSAVKLARKEQAIKYRREQQLYQLRCMEKRGLELMSKGIDFNNIEFELFGKSEE